MEKVFGKNQSYCREINFELVIDLLRKEPRSATQLADMLKLSNATMSSIIKDLLELGMIDIAKSASIKGKYYQQVKERTTGIRHRFECRDGFESVT